VGRQVVDRGEVVDVVDLALELLDVVGGDAELLRRQVAEHRAGALLGHAPVAEQVGDLAFALRPQQEIHRRAAALQQSLDEALADEAGGSGDEILHGFSSLMARADVAAILVRTLGGTTSSFTPSVAKTGSRG